MKKLILMMILGISAALSAHAEVEKAQSYDSFRIEVANDKPISVVLSYEGESCGLTALLGTMRPISVPENSEEQIIYMDYYATSTYQACNPFVKPEKHLVKSEPLTIQPLPGAAYLKLIVPAGVRVALVP